MLMSRQERGNARGQQGSDLVDIAELRRQLARPSELSDGNRQCLLDLARTVARVQARGGEYRRVSLSEHVVDALRAKAPAV